MIKVTKYWDRCILDTNIEYYWLNPDNISYLFVQSRGFWKTTRKPGYNSLPADEMHNSTCIVMLTPDDVLSVNETPEEIMALIAKR